MSEGRELDVLIAEHILGWRRIQGPKYDYNGPLPEQGEVLCPPELDPANFSWPPFGVVPLEYFLGTPPRWFSTNIAAAWLVVEAMKARGCDFSTVWRDGKWYACFAMGGALYEAYADTAPEAICRAALAAGER